MTYSISIHRTKSDTTYINDIKTWKEVTDYIKNKLECNVVYVYIAKYGSDDRLLGERKVGMHNVWDVLTAEKDKYALL